MLAVDAAEDGGVGPCRTLAEIEVMTIAADTAEADEPE